MASPSPLPFDGEQAQAGQCWTRVAKAVDRRSARFSGRTPYPSLNIVESPFFDGHGIRRAFLPEPRTITPPTMGTVLNNLIDIGVHETAHQWWFASVGNNQALEPWLDEALATYSERLFYEKNYRR